MKSMRSVLLLLPAVALLAQTPAPKKAAPPAKPAAPAVARNYKLSGNPSASLTIEVYTDYECPSCRQLYMTTLPDLTAQYVSTGKVQMLHRDFPLPQHAYSKLAARYANAAGQLGKYDLVANQLFTAQNDWAQNGNVDGTVAKVLPAADMVKVRELVKSDSHLDDTVAADTAMGQRDAITQTPTIIVVKNGKRQKIDGYVPFNILKSYIDQLLAKG